MPASVYKLDNDSLSDIFLDDARLLGLVSAAKDYQLCLQVNNTLQFDFRLDKNLEVRMKKGRKNCYYNVFVFNESMKSVNHYLFNNHFRTDFLLPELKQFDCLWLVKGDYYHTGELKQLIELVREIECIRLAAELPLSEVKNRSNLTLD